MLGGKYSNILTMILVILIVAILGILGYFTYDMLHAKNVNSNALSAIDEFELDYSNTAAYSPRQGTVAAKWTDKFLDEATKKERLARLNDKNKEACLKSNQKALGKTYEVLVEDYEEKNGKIILKSKSRNNKYVHFEGEKDLIGKFIKVKITKASVWHLEGEFLS